MKLPMLGPAVVVALALAAPALAQGPAPGEEEAAAFFGWLTSALERGDWRLSALGPGAAIFTQKAEGAAGGVPRLWVRLELQKPVVPSGTLSMRQLVEFDCDERQVRTLEGVSYRQNNLSGPSAPQSNFGGWSPVQAGQALDDVVSFACGLPPAQSVPPEAL
jgi:hypothetical protein